MKTKAQLAAINSNANRIVVVAGPGSGKTTTSLARMVRLINESVPASAIAAITFTNAAALETESRLANLIPGAKLGFCGTLHSFMLRLLQTNGPLVGFNRAISIASESFQNELIDTLIEDFRWKGSRKAVVDEIARGPFENVNTPLEVIRGDYYGRMKKAGLIDFDGILFYGLELVRKQFAPGFQHLFVDEFQDSSTIDFQIYQAIKIPNLFIVGDVDQSIYGFRGGNPSLLMRLLESEHGCKFILNENFRSGKEICEIGRAHV